MNSERERIARLAENCHATYELNWERASFADLIRSGATTPPWWQTRSQDPTADQATEQDEPHATEG